MLINLFPIAFFNEYIISPKTWLHYIKYDKKIMTLFFYLCYFYYLNSMYSIIVSLIFITAIIYLSIQFNIRFSNLHAMLLYYFIIYNIFIYNNVIQIGIHTIIKELLIQKKITYIRVLEIIYRNINLINKTSYLLILPKLFIKITLIPVTSFLCLKILFLTTKYEHIILYTIALFKYLKTISGINISFLITISSQFLLLFSQKISFLTLSFQLRNMNLNFIQQYMKAYYLLLIEFLSFSDSRIKTIAFILYIRKINYNQVFCGHL